jgi:pimeloyl-ACP methyl ester carboxylesterase
MNLSTELPHPDPRPTHTQVPLAVRALFRTGHRFAPRWTARMAAEIFARPRRRELTHNEAALVESARTIELVVEGRRLHAWCWGDPDAPAVVGHHGWGGRGAQLAAFGPRLAAAGYYFVSYDAPAHGESSGRRTNLVDMTDTLTAVLDRLGDARALVTHSMGGMVAARALGAGAAPNALASIAPPGGMHPYLKIFAASLGVGTELEEGILSEIQRRVGLSRADLDCSAMIPGRRIPFLLVYDESDRDVPPEHARRWAEHWPDAAVLRTSGLGHRGILRDGTVQHRVTEFLLRESAKSARSFGGEE